MAINFPNSPSLNETYSENDTSWKWDGTSWNRLTGLVGTESSTLSGVGVTQFARRDVNNVITGITTLSTSGVGNTTLNVEGDSRFGSNIKVTGVSTFTGGANIPDSSGSATALRIGDSQDIKLYHNGSHSYLDNATGDLYIRGNGDDLILEAADDVFITPNDGDSGIKVLGEGSVELYEAGDKKFETTLTGASVTGDLAASGNVTGVAATFTGDVKIGGVLTYEDVKNVDSVGIITAREGIFLPDSKTIKLGNTAAIPDFTIEHNGTNSIIDTNTGDLILRTDADDIKLLAEDDIVLRDNDDSTNFIHCINGAGVKLYNSGNERLYTTNTGVNITGIPVATQNSGNVGLELHATGSGRGSQTKYHNDHGEAYVGQAGDTTGNLLVHNTSNTNIIFATNDTPRVTLASNGNFGIGNRTGSPNSLLHVHTASGDAVAKVEGGADSWLSLISHGGDSQVRFGDAASGAAGQIRFDHGTNHLFFEIGGSQRGKIASDGSTYWGPSTSTEAQLQWTHDTNQRPHIFWGQSGGAQPSDGAVVVASPQTDICSQRVGAFIFASATSGGSGNTGLKAALECYTNASPGSDFNAGGDIRFLTKPNNSQLVLRMSIDSNGHLIPATNNTYDLGSVAKGWRNVYTNDLNLSNLAPAGNDSAGNPYTRPGNDVDGTNGSWTIQEGKDDLYIINRLDGKKYKFNLTEVS